MPIFKGGLRYDKGRGHKLTAAFLKEFGFITTGIDEQGEIYSALNKENGDIFSFDCSYNNMEFSFGKEI